MFPFNVFRLVVKAAIVALLLVFLYPFFSRALKTREDAMRDVRKLREHLRNHPDSDHRSLLGLFYELVVTTVLVDPTARSEGERSDVELDLHEVSEPDAEELVKRLLRKARSTTINPLFVKYFNFGEWVRFAGDTNYTWVLRVDAGGLHEEGGAVLQPMVRSLLKKAKYRFEIRVPPQEGVFVIDQLSGDLNDLAAAEVTSRTDL